MGPEVPVIACPGPLVMATRSSHDLVHPGWTMLDSPAPLSVPSASIHGTCTLGSSAGEGLSIWHSWDSRPHMAN